MGKAFKQTVTLVLACKHVVEISNPAPMVGEEQYCRRCADWITVEQAPPVYRAQCVTGRCTLNKGGKDKEHALSIARNHVGKMTRHKVNIVDGLRTIATITNTDEALFATREERAAIAADGAKLLKKFGLGGTAAA